MSDSQQPPPQWGAPLPPGQRGRRPPMSPAKIVLIVVLAVAFLAFVGFNIFLLARPGGPATFFTGSGPAEPTTSTQVRQTPSAKPAPKPQNVPVADLESVVADLGMDCYDFGKPVTDELVRTGEHGFVQGDTGGVNLQLTRDDTAAAKLVVEPPSGVL